VYVAGGRLLGSADQPFLVVGDLDPMLSAHTLLPLKTVYKKLRLLVDLGCIFIGHGLTKDFRIISELNLG
jgi:hypothetical protein